MLNTQAMLYESLIDKFKVGYALKLVAKSNVFLYKISGIAPIDKYIRLYRKDISGATVYYFNPGDKQEYTLTNNTNAFLQSDNNEMYIYTLGVTDGIAVEVYNPQTTPLLGTEYAPDAFITYEKSPIENPNPMYRFKSFRTKNFIVVPKIIAENKRNTVVVNPYIRIYGVSFELTPINELPETYTTISLYGKNTR